MRTLAMILLVALTGAACGEDEPPPPPPSGGPAPARPGPPPKGAPPKGKPLQPRMKIEDRVPDPTEKASLRHQFRDRDFAVEQNNRDPFQSFVLGGPLNKPGTGTAGPDITKNCKRTDQLVATNYSYMDLRLVGIVAERAQRKVLMMDKGNLGHIIKKGDCVGREKAVVTAIGAGFVTFQVVPEGIGERPVEEHSVQLYPNQLPVTSQPTPEPDASTTAPVVAPGQIQPTAPTAPGPVSPSVEAPR